MRWWDAQRESLGVTPLPASSMLCGKLVALPTKVMRVERGPIAFGAKSALIWHFAPAASDEPQLVVKGKLDALAPPIEMLLMDMDALPVLVSTTTCEALD